MKKSKDPLKEKEYSWKSDSNFIRPYANMSIETYKKLISAFKERGIEIETAMQLADTVIDIVKQEVVTIQSAPTHSQDIMGSGTIAPRQYNKGMWKLLPEDSVWNETQPVNEPVKKKKWPPNTPTEGGYFNATWDFVPVAKDNGSVNIQTSWYV